MVRGIASGIFFPQISFARGIDDPDWLDIAAVRTVENLTDAFGVTCPTRESEP